MRVIEIPSQEQAADMLRTASECADFLIGAPVEEPAEIDWNGVFYRAQQMLNKGGSGKQTGTIVLNDFYPLKRTLLVDSHIELVGAWRAKHHIGSSCGFVAADGFEGQWMLEWKQPNPGARYSNFGAGMRQIHVECSAGVSGAMFRGAQQSAGVENVVIRGVGADQIGLMRGGDTYSVRDVFIDSTGGGEGSGVQPGATAIKASERMQGIVFQNVTSHNCETGMELMDPVEIDICSFETELTENPVVLKHNASGVKIRNAQFRHTEQILHVEKARWPADFLVLCEGRMVGKESRGEVVLPGSVFATAGKTFDLAVQGDRKGIKGVDLKAMRQKA